MTKQEFYDRICRAAFDGTFPSVHSGGCLYRLDKTAHCKQRCPVGMLIPDEEYYPDMECNTVQDLSTFYAIRFPDEMVLGDLIAVQECHDDYAHNNMAWNGREFLAQLNRLSCFRDIIKKEIAND